MKKVEAAVIHKLVKATMDVVDTVHVDMQNLRVAGRVNLGDWLEGDAETR